MSRKIAFGGILTALCVVLLYLAAYLPTGKLGIYALASVTIAIAVVELDIKLGAVVYAASAILIFLLTGNINTLLIFTLFFGGYPLIKYYIEKQRSSAMEMLLKFGAFNLLAILGLFIFKLLLGVSPINIGSFSGWMLIGLIIAGQVAFIIYDYILSRLIDYYFNKIRSSMHNR
jgi:putative flippase GtrA